MKQEFNGISIENIVLDSHTIINISLGTVRAGSSDSLLLQQECEDFLKYLKAKYN